MPTSFLDLPRELRDQIYDSLWTSTPKIFLSNEPSMARIVACYKSHHARESSLPKWLLTNKQTLAEATEQMVRHGTWIVWLRSEYDEQRIGSLLSPVLARRLTITLTHPLEVPRSRWPHVVSEPMLRPSKESAECFARIMSQLSSTSHAARDVRLILELVREEAHASVDLSPLESARGLKPGLHKLDVVVAREHIHRAYSAEFVEAISAAVKRMGNKVMGNDEDPGVSGIFQDRGLMYTFEKPEEMELYRVDSATGVMD